MKRVLITGATGFVGANLTRRLLDLGHDVHLFARARSDFWRIEDILSQVHVHTVPLEDGEAVALTVASIGPEWIFHLAAHGAYSWQQDWRAMVDTNIVGTMNLVKACLATGFEAFVNTGSSSEYGFKDHAPSESEVLEPNSYYAATKAAATHLSSLVAREREARIVTLRLYSVYGPYEEPHRLVPTLLVHGLSGRLPPLVSPDVARDYVYVDDVIDAYLLAATAHGIKPGAVYNVGSGKQTTIRAIVELARAILNITSKPRWGSMPDRGWDTSVWVADNRNIREHLGWCPQHSLEEGLKTTTDWLLSKPGMLHHYSASILGDATAPKAPTLMQSGE